MRSASAGRESNSKVAMAGRGVTLAFDVASAETLRGSIYERPAAAVEEEEETKDDVSF